MPQLGTTPKSPKEFGSAEANTPNSALAMVFRACKNLSVDLGSACARLSNAVGDSLFIELSSETKIETEDMPPRINCL